MRDNILRSAFKLYTSKPPWEITIEDIAFNAGISTSLIFYYFKSKENLEREVAFYIIENYLRFEADTLKEYVKKALELVEEMPGLSRFLHYIFEKELYTGKRELAQKLYNESLKIIMRLVEDYNLESPEEKAILIMAMLDGLALYSLFLDLKVRKFADKIIELIKCGD